LGSDGYDEYAGVDRARMVRLLEATQRLERAVSRLEAALRGRGAGDAQRLTESQADFAALTETAQSVAARLDAAIGRLDRALER
jgi:hypothetical protein